MSNSQEDAHEARRLLRKERDWERRRSEAEEEKRAGRPNRNAKDSSLYFDLRLSWISPLIDRTRITEVIGDICSVQTLTVRSGSEYACRIVQSYLILEDQYNGLRKEMLIPVY
uniref:Uncharacterized protein n=1 Tax=Amphimedon queenslandica TaxID=400682 RepID=A0A1X7T729_AMPQE